jgi:hypothetical protein
MVEVLNSALAWTFMHVSSILLAAYFSHVPTSIYIIDVSSMLINHFD